MASQPKVLRVVEVRDAGPLTRLLDVECIEGGAFAAFGGKYVIVHTGLVVADRAVKRAYSLRPVPGHAGRARLTIKRIDDGPGSKALHEASVGTELGFSGPWGKLVPDGGWSTRTLVVATDTGITTALGICEEANLAKQPAPIEILWLRAPDDAFLDDATVRASVEESGARLVVVDIPNVDDASRTDIAFRVIDERVRAVAPELVVATGDGAIVHPLRTKFGASSHASGGASGDPSGEPAASSVRDVRIECFFRNPEKKSGTSS